MYFLDLELAGGAHLGMVILHGDTRFLHPQAHFAAAFIGAVQGFGHMIGSLIGDHVALAVGNAVPVALLGVQAHPDGTGLYLPADLIEEIELEFRQHQHGIGDAGGAHIILGSLDDVPGILIQGPVLRIVDDHGVAGHGQGFDIAEGVHIGRVQVGDEDHVALLHHRVAVVGGVEAHTVRHHVLAEILRGDGHVAELAVDVHHFEVHHLDPFVPDHTQDVLHRIRHGSFSS